MDDSGLRTRPKPNAWSGSSRTNFCGKTLSRYHLKGLHCSRQLCRNRSSRKIDSRRLVSREQDFGKTFSLTQNPFSGKTYFYTIRPCSRSLSALRLSTLPILAWEKGKVLHLVAGHIWSLATPGFWSHLITSHPPGGDCIIVARSNSHLATRWRDFFIYNLDFGHVPTLDAC